MLSDAAVNGRHPDRGRGRGARPVWVAALTAALLSAGCKPNKRYDLIEAELRTRDRELRDVRAALEQARVLNHVYEQQLQPHAARTADPVVGGPVAVPIKDVAVGRGTGGRDEDGCPGDEALEVVVVPRDEDGSAVKVPARATVWAWDIAPQGVKTLIGTWDVPPDRLRPTWRGGLFGSGYTLVLAWQTAPVADRVRVAVRLTTLDGRVYEADRDVTVRAAHLRGPSPVPPGAEELPPVQGYPVRPANPVVPPVFPPNPGRETLPPAAPPPGAPPAVPGSPVPPGTEELPPPGR